MDNTNQAEIASIGEELDENFLFNDTESLNRSVTSLASLACSCDSSKRPIKTKGFTITKLWNRKNPHLQHLESK